jgi:transposase
LEVQDLQQMLDPRIKANLLDITEALNGRIRKHHRDMLRFHWDHIAYIDVAISKVEEQIDYLLTPYQEEFKLLETIPGVNKAAAATFIAEMGTDMSVFKSSKHLASWAGVSPGNYESAGKKKQ